VRAVHVSLGAGLDGTVMREHERPRPGPRELLLRMHATSLNFREISILKHGRYPLPVKPDVIGLCDGAGEVVELGAGATQFAVGDRVVASIFPRWQDGPFRIDRAAQLGGSLDGMLADYVALPEDSLVGIPPHLSYEEAAAVPCAAVTAWNALAGAAPPRPGETVLVQGSGGVSLFALQFAKSFGARVIATTSSDAKAEALRALGADEVLDYRLRPDWPCEVRRLTQGVGVQHVIEVGGGLAHAYAAVSLGGEVALVGTLGGAAQPLDAAVAFASGATLRPIAAGSRAQLASALRAMDAHRLRPVIARTFGFDEVAAALAWYEAGQAFGKVVIRVA
jgi:NADPH:quinone reductase-like Zn-dependent oxidoreductase